MIGAARKTLRLDSKTLSILKKTYPIGSKVEAVRVNGIPNGSRGIVQSVQPNGDIFVIWTEGGQSNIEFGVECVSAIVEGRCLLGYGYGSCGMGECKECGWNDKVHKERLRRIRSNGMKIKKDGTRALVVPKRLARAE